MKIFHFFYSYVIVFLETIRYIFVINIVRANNLSSYTSVPILFVSIVTYLYRLCHRHLEVNNNFYCLFSSTLLIFLPNQYSFPIGFCSNIFLSKKRRLFVCAFGYFNFISEFRINYFLFALNNE